MHDDFFYNISAEASLRVVSAFSSIAAATTVSKVHSSCPYLSDSSQRLFRDHVLAKVRDLEELHEMGMKYA